MSDSRWMQQVERGTGALAARSHRRPALALGLATLLVAGGLLAARNLSLSANLAELLPRSFRSVQDIDKLAERFGGIGYIVVVGQGAEPEVLRRFADEIAPELARLPDIRFVEHKRAAEFFEDHALYYLGSDDLKTIQRRIDARVAYERRQKNPLFIDLEEEEAPPLDFADLEAKYAGGSAKRLAGSGEDYYLDAKERMVVVLAKPAGNSSNLGYGTRVLRRVEKFLAGRDMSEYGPDFHVALTGTFKKKVDQEQQINRDLGVASAVALVLLLLFLAMHFRSGLAVGLVLTPVLAGLAWTYGFVGIAYGQVNLLTAFLGAILGGLGVEHGIHLLGRYESLVLEGESSVEATREAFTHTGGAALISSLVASLTFLSLAISEFRAFREFGIIAAAGMVLTVAAYVLVLPALLGLCARFGWRPKAARTVAGHASELARWLPRHATKVSIAVGAVMLLLAVNATSIRFDYDFAALEDGNLPSFVLDRKVNRILGYSQTPVIVLTDNQTEEREVVAELFARKRRLGARSSVDFVAALSDLVPLQQREKREVLQAIHATLDKLDGVRLDGSARRQFDRALRLTAAQPFARGDLPQSVRRQFQGEGGGGFVLVFPNVSLSHGEKVRALAKEVRDIKVGGRTLSAAGEAMVLADILDMVASESAPILIMALLSVLLAMWLTLGSIRAALICILPTAVSILALLGLMPLAGMRFNYLNIMMIPVLIGVTVDAGVHLVSRLADASEDFAGVYAETGRAICGGLLTSAVGFGALLLAAHPGLNSVGKLANLGFATNLLAMLLGFPALLAFLRKRRNKEALDGAASVATSEELSRGG